MVETKRCTKCGRELPLSEFCKQKTGKNGLMPICRTCNRKKVKEWGAAHPERIREKQRQYRQRKRDKIQKKLERREEKEREFRKKIFNLDVLGGYRIYILNYPTKSERKYNVVSTAGDVFKTNSKAEFLQFVQGL